MNASLLDDTPETITAATFGLNRWKQEICRALSDALNEHCPGFLNHPMIGAGEQQTKRPPGKRRPFLSRENSSNGSEAVKTFWQNLMRVQEGVSRNFLTINTFVFNNL